MSDGDPAVVAFYLPQFHPIPENDAWWGAGFTEWRNVVQAVPRFPGHEQPHLPADLGFYDLRLPETREQQADLARRHGVQAFCYYHYWFGGKQLLQRPFDEVLASGSPDFPFFLCWANEPWNRAWDGLPHDVLIAQQYSEADHRAHIERLTHAFADRRYFRVEDRPVFLVYRPRAIPDVAAVLGSWRTHCRRAGVGDPYFVAVETLDFFQRDPAEVGCDATTEFLPHGIHRFAERLDGPDPYFASSWIYDYDEVVAGHLAAPRPSWRHFRCVVPSWDNSPRRVNDSAIVLHGSTPASFGRWTRGIVDQARAEGTAIVFVNGWNEWAEGAHLEPDLRHGRAYLEALAGALGFDPTSAARPHAQPDRGSGTGRARSLRQRLAATRRLAQAGRDPVGRRMLR